MTTNDAAGHLLATTAHVVAAYVREEKVSPEALAALIMQVYTLLQEGAHSAEQILTLIKQQQNTD